MKKMGSNLNRWSEKEKDLLEQWADIYTIHEMSQMLTLRNSQRTTAAISKKLSQLGLSAKRTLDNFTANNAANLLGVSYPTIWRWINKGYLKASVSKSSRLDNPKRTEYLVNRKDLLSLIQHPPKQLRLSRIKAINPQVIQFLKD